MVPVAYRSPILIDAFFARPTALHAPQRVEHSDQIECTEATCGPRRQKWLVMVTQGDGEHPAAASGGRTLGKKYRTTKLVHGGVRRGRLCCHTPGAASLYGRQTCSARHYSARRRTPVWRRRPGHPCPTRPGPSSRSSTGSSTICSRSRGSRHMCAGRAQRRHDATDPPPPAQAAK